MSIHPHHQTPTAATSPSLVLAARVLLSLLLPLTILLLAPTRMVAAEASEQGSIEWKPWSHYSMDDLELDVNRFRPLRARYLQVMYDLDGNGEVQSTGIVHLDLDRTIHSGPWNGEAPAVIVPLREPGLRVVWQVQNALYNGFDRVLTDSRLSLWQRVMPAGTSGLRVGAVAEGNYAHLNTATSIDENEVTVKRTRLPRGAVNVLTLPYVLAAMDLEPGDRFTLPGFAMIGGPDGEGMEWTGAYRVESVSGRTVKGERHRVVEVLSSRMDSKNGRTLDHMEQLDPEGRYTRLLISDRPPYLLGRTNLRFPTGGPPVPVRELLGLVDWAAQPLPTSDLVDLEMWELDLDEASIQLDAARTPELIVPLLDP